MFIFPHGIHVDRDGNVWVTDGRAASKEELAKFPDAPGQRAITVIKFSPDGKVLMTLGKPGVRAARHRHVQRAERRDHGAERRHLRLRRPQRPEPDRDPRHERPHREVHEGRQVRQGVGQVRLGPGEFRTPHALAMDSRGRLFVADRGNHRIQIFDQDGKFLEEWKQFSRVSGLFITRNDKLYAIDSESSPERHPNWKTGVRIGTTKEDKVLQFIPPHALPKGEAQGAAGEGVAVDPDGNVYAAEGPISRQAAGGGLTKYAK